MTLAEKTAHATFDAIKRFIPEAASFTPEFVAIIEAYLQPFAKIIGLENKNPPHNCLKCNAFACGFRWGIRHGEGECSYCGWPARGYHYLKDETGEERRIVVVLQYHPDGVKLRRKIKS